MLSQRKDRATKTLLLDWWIIVQAVAVGTLLFGLNLGMPGLQGFSVVFGVVAVLGLAAFLGMGWARGLVAGVVTTYAVILFTPITNVMADSLVVNCSDTAGDAIVVLGGDPGYARILHGLRLLGQGGASVLVITGDEGRPGGWNHDEVATLFGVREDRLVLFQLNGPN